jgi:anti-sigma-K factor RskA
MTGKPAQLDRAKVERLLALLADESTGPLTPEERAELNALVEEGLTDECGRAIGEDDMHRVAGELIAASVEREKMPAHVRSEILARAARERGEPARAATPTAPRTRDWGGWAAAAAAVLIAALGWLRTPPTPTTATPEQLAAALEADAQTVRVPWTSPGDAAGAGASGDVLWNNRLQRGFMRIKGLAKNDRAVEQYQLWIIDSGRSEPQPVDGGVFDFEPGAGGTAVIPIRAAIAVRTPAAFAVTVEKPGGVVVSRQERVPLLAQIKG